MIVNYGQFKDIAEAEKFVQSIKAPSTIEITVHGEDPWSALPEKACVLIDRKAVYSLNFKASQYKLNDTEFYLSKKEALDVYLYLKSLHCETMPHWWPYAERNIRRHGDPLKVLREALAKGAEVEVRFN